MARGFIKEVGGNMRHRIVKAGLNADNMATAPNDVVFDTVDIGTLSVITSGVYRLVRAGATPVTARIASWSSLSYVPLCTFQFLHAGIPQWYTFETITSTGYHQKITVDTGGITATMIPYAGGYTDIKYQVYRLPVV